MSLDEEGSKNFFNNIMNLWILPEIEKRKNESKKDDPFVLIKAQVIFHPDTKSKSVRLNDEVQATLYAKPKKDSSWKKGDAVYEHQLDSIERIELAKDEDPEAGHVTMIQFKGNWIIHFDFRYYKGKLKQIFNVAQEFYDTAKVCKEKKSFRAFIDNLFSSIELLTICQIYNMVGDKFREKQTHKGTQNRYNAYVNMGNFKPKFKETLNSLSSMRDSARYMKSTFKLTDEESDAFVKVADEMFDYTKKVIGI